MGKRSRPEYPVELCINERRFRRVVIDQHYREKHAATISDALILRLVRELDGKHFPIAMIREEFEFFVVEPVWLDKRPYRMVLVLCQADDFLGVVNAFRVVRSEK